MLGRFGGFRVIVARCDLYIRYFVRLQSDSSCFRRCISQFSEKTCTLRPPVEILMTKGQVLLGGGKSTACTPPRGLVRIQFREF